MLHAGFGMADITPNQHGLLSGYYLRTSASTGIHDPIGIRILLLQANHVRCALCVLDLIGVPQNLLNGIRKRVGTALSIPEEAVQVSATHTHAAPDAILLSSPAYDPQYTEFIFAAAESAARQAATLHSVSVYYSHTQVGGVGSYRGRLREESAFQMPCDTIIFKNPAHRNIALTVFACHPTVLNEDNLLISRDLVYGCDKHLQKLVPNTDFLFFNGSCGDISSRYTRRASTYDEMERLGSLWARAVSHSLPLAAPLDSTLWYRKKYLFVPPAEYFTDTERTEIIAYLETKIAACTDSQQQREYIASHSALVMPSYGTGRGCTAELTVIGLGDLALCMMPFEAASVDTQALACQIFEKYHRRAVFFGYSNGDECYLPSGRPLDRDSGYEDMMASVHHNAKFLVMESFRNIMQDEANHPSV